VFIKSRKKKVKIGRRMSQKQSIQQVNNAYVGKKRGRVKHLI
jgi:hypothetical protein